MIAASCRKCAEITVVAAAARCRMFLGTLVTMFEVPADIK